jgi:hypothetical protein
MHPLYGGSVSISMDFRGAAWRLFIEKGIFTVKKE